MACIKFSIIFLLIISQAFAQSRFSPKACLDSEYKMKMTQKGPLFGLLKQEFIINKKNCLIHVTHKKYLPKEWIIDICREPVHIKVTSATGVDVAKKEAPCLKKDKSKDNSDFCAQYYNLMDVIQDDGLIFAEGDRDNLSSDHGKTYCAYLLLKKYLNDSYVFSRYTEVPDIFLDTPREEAPTQESLESKDEENSTKIKIIEKEAQVSTGLPNSAVSNF
jgi:hypothetical protein